MTPRTTEISVNPSEETIHLGTLAVRFLITRDDASGKNVKALCAITPAAIGPQYFREAADVVNAAAGGPPDRAKTADIMRRHGLTPAS